MKSKLQEQINYLPVIQKAHIYEPKIEEVADISVKAGMREVVDWVNTQIKVSAYVYIAMPEWQAKLKEWGIEK